jgi:hypothetical protein
MTENRSIDRSEIELELDLIVLQPTELLVLPDTPNIYLTPQKAKKLLCDLQNAIENSREGVIIKLNGKINPRVKPDGEDESMFLTKELKSGRVRENHPDSGL